MRLGEQSDHPVSGTRPTVLASVSMQDAYERTVRSKSWIDQNWSATPSAIQMLLHTYSLSLEGSILLHAFEMELQQ